MTDPSHLSSLAGRIHPGDWLEPQGSTYNLFQNIGRPELLCAVALHRPVPGFISKERWTFRSQLHPVDAHPPGFRARAARTGTMLNGFYLFQVTLG
jgi:hypothetical protein